MAINTIRFEPPTADTPGYLQRQIEVMELQARMQEAEKANDPREMVAAMEKMAKFLSQFIVEPQDKAQKVQAILSLSQNQFEALITAIAGEGNNEAPKTQTGERSDNIVPFQNDE